MDKPKVLVFIDWFYPAYKAGGPIRSVSGMVKQLSNDFEFYLVTSNQDLGEEIIDVAPNKWIKKKEFSVIYLDNAKRGKKTYLKIISKINPSKIYINSLFSRSFSIEPILAARSLNFNQKIVLAPRGMLGAGALKEKKLKKFSFLILTNWIQFFKGITWHSTSASESEEIRKWFPKSTIKLAKNLVELPDIIGDRVSNKNKNELKLIFLSRISSKKNLLFAIDLISNYSNISLDIFGPIEDQDYWNECNKVILEKDVKAEYKGVAKPNELDEILIKYDFFLFPTLHENFGHVISESLLRGTPVICSDQTYWRNLEKQKAGFDLPLDKEVFKKTLNFCYEMTPEIHQEFIEGSTNLGKNYALDKTEINNTKKLFSIE